MGRRKVRILAIILAAVVIVAIVLGVLFYMSRKDVQKLTAEADELALQITNNTLNTYVAKVDIKKGDQIFDDVAADEQNAQSQDPSEARDEQTAGAILTAAVEPNVEQRKIFTNLGADAYIVPEQMQSVALVDIPAGTPIMANMVKPLTITQDTREFEITAVNLMVDQQENDYIDIRIAFPNGEEYTVLSKKQIRNLSLAYADFWTYMTEREMLTYRSAVCDAYQTTGAYLYAVRYAESNLQDAASVNYLVRSETIDLLRSDPNIYDVAEQTMNASARLSLEVRLGQLTQDQLSAVADGLGIADTAKSAVLSQNVDNNSSVISSYSLDNHERSSDSTGSTSSSNGSTNNEQMTPAEESENVDTALDNPLDSPFGND